MHFLRLTSLPHKEVLSTLPFDCLYSSSPGPFFDQPLVEGRIIIAWRVEVREREPR